MKPLFGVVAAAVVLVALMGTVQKANSAHILIVQPSGTRSHKNFFVAIAENLVKRNHTVTHITGFKSSTARNNIREIVLPDTNAFMAFPSLFNTSLVTMTWQMLPIMVNYCSDALVNTEVQELLKEGFDLMMLYIYMTDCFLSLAHQMNAPFIYVNPNVVQGSYSDLAGTPFFPSLQGPLEINVEYPLTFFGRMASTLTDLSYEVFKVFYTPWVESVCRDRQLCPEDMPSLKELRLNSSLFITNSVRTMENPTLPYTPTVVHAGGIHCRPPQPLPQDLEQWVTASGQSGFIFFSLGTFVKSSTLPEKYLKVLLEVFGSLPQRVLWKWDQDTIEGLPHNVKLSRWLPQQDLLGHPQLRLFITHGGLFSTQEAIYHGVPVLGLPVAVDQHHNMYKVEREGWGHCLEWEDLTYATLRRHILEIMEDTRLKEVVERRASIMRDQPMPPGDWATYWIEYILRHQGAHHLRSHAVYMPWYQLYNVDVWALVVVVTLLTMCMTIWLTFKILRVLLRCCRLVKTKND